MKWVLRNYLNNLTYICDCLEMVLKYLQTHPYVHVGAHFQTYIIGLSYFCSSRISFILLKLS